MSTESNQSRRSSASTATGGVSEADSSPTRVDSHEAIGREKPKLNVAPPAFKICSLWHQPRLNPTNGKSQTLPLFNLNNQYSRNFHLSWLSFFVAFLSWFAFAPLVPAIRDDLELTETQIGNSNIAGLSSTLLVRFAVGPLVDRYGPRWTMASILILGAIPSGLAGTVTNAGGLYVVRFMIGLLGGTFIPCQAWTSIFYDRNIVGSANALAAGWGNMGAGVTFFVQTGLYESLIGRGLTSSQSWRAAFAVVPVPILLVLAALDIVFGTDCPAGKWKDRHNLPSSAVALQQDFELVCEEREGEKRKQESATVEEAPPTRRGSTGDMEKAVAEPLTWRSFRKMLATPATWITPLLYMITFGTELAIDANIANVYLTAHESANFGQLEAGFYGAIYGLMNICWRFFGGLAADWIYPRFGVSGKKHLTAWLAAGMAVFTIAQGIWQREVYANGGVPALSTQLGLIIANAIFGFMSSGVCFALVPHCSPSHLGVMSGITGAFGNIGGIFAALAFRFETGASYANAFIAVGAMSLAVSIATSLIPTKNLK